MVMVWGSRMRGSSGSIGLLIAVAVAAAAAAAAEVVSKGHGPFNPQWRSRWTHYVLTFA